MHRCTDVFTAWANFLISSAYTHRGATYRTANELGLAAIHPAFKRLFFSFNRYSEGASVSVKVKAGKFRDDSDVPNVASSMFTVLML